MTVKEIEDLIVSKLAALKDRTLAALFEKVGSAVDNDWRVAAIKKGTKQPIVSAWVALEEDTDTGTRSRVISDETYAIVVVSKKGTADAERTAYALTDAVILALHGKDFLIDELGGFYKQDRTLVDNRGSLVVYKVRFTVRHAQYIPTPT